MARDLRGLSRNRQVNGCGERHDRRIYPRGEISLWSLVVGMVGGRKARPRWNFTVLGAPPASVGLRWKQKKPHRASAEAIAPFRAWRSPKETISATRLRRDAAWD